jgi:hypothetical protein
MQDWAEIDLKKREDMDISEGEIKRTQRDSNPRHAVPKTAALSAELWVQQPLYPLSYGCISFIVA